MREAAPAIDRARSLAALRPAAVRAARAYGAPDPEDVAQEAMLVLHRRALSLEPPLERAFVIGTARRIALRARRNASRCVADDAIEIADGSESADERIAWLEASAHLEDALATLSPEERELYALFEREGLTKDEVASALGIPVGTAASRRARVRRDVDQEVRRALAVGAAPCVAARADLFLAGRDWYAERGLSARYRDALPGRLRAGYDALDGVAWVSLDTAMELYAASSSLGLADADAVDVGRHVFRRVNGAALVGMVGEAGTSSDDAALRVIENASQLWRNAFEGGTVGIRRVASAEMELEFRAPMFRFDFFGHCIFGAVSEALEGPANVRVRVKRHTRRSLVLAVEPSAHSWANRAQAGTG